MEIKIIEEWGFAIGEDACLLDDDADSKASIPDKCYDNVAPEISDQVDNLVNNLADDWATDIDIDECQHFSNIPYDNNKEDGTVKVVGVCEMEATSNKNVIDVPFKATDNTTLQKVDIYGQEDKQLKETDAQGAGVKVDSHHFVESSKTSLRRKRQNSCPPRTTRSFNLGPWSIEWLQDQVHGDVGVVSSSKQASKIKKNTQVNSSKLVKDDTTVKEVKLDNKLKHSARNLKKIARLPVDDRKQVLKILMKKVHRRRGVKMADALNNVVSKGSHVSEFSSSASNDWKNWVVLRGKDEVVKEDINCFGMSLGVKFYKDKANRFRVLSRGRNQRTKSVEEVGVGSQKV